MNALVQDVAQRLHGQSVSRATKHLKVDQQTCQPVVVEDKEVLVELPVLLDSTDDLCPFSHVLLFVLVARISSFHYL